MAVFTKELLNGEVAIFIVLVLICIYLWFQYKFTYWRRKGVIGPKPSFPFGNIGSVIQKKSQFFQPYVDNYFKFKHLPYVGLYTFHRPVLSINDPEIARLILIKDFDHFQAHGIFSGGVGDPLAGHLFNKHGEEWKTLRSKLSPSFTVGKIKSVFPLVENIANEALEYLDLLYSNQETVNFTDLFTRNAMEIVASVGFGVKCNGFKNLKTEFYIRGREYFDPESIYWTAIRSLAFLMPDIFDFLKIRRISEDIISFFYSLVKDTVDYRTKNSYNRNDFLQTLMELNNQKDMVGFGDKPFQLSMDELVANTMLYLFAGFESSASTGQMMAYELARAPELQNRAREEIKQVLDKHKGVCTYEALSEMVFLHMVKDETLRFYPPMRAIFRRCNKNYKVPDTDLVIEKGTMIFIPNQAMHLDPEFFPEPEKFDPERFSPGNKSKIPPCHYMPFGEGPRKCLGIRQSHVQVLTALVKILSKYELSLDDRTPYPPKIKATSVSLGIEDGVWLKLRKLED